METFFQNIGFSFTFSKLMPYIIFFLFGLILFFLVRNKIKSKKTRIFLLILFPLIFFVGYFIIHPIYEGDFSNNSKEIQFSGNEFDTKEPELFIIAIPGCPFCLDALKRMSIVKQKNQKIKIQFIVCSTNEKSLEPYKKSIPKGVKFTISQNEKLMTEVAKGSFPTFVFSDGKTIKKWRNDDFGVVALDEVLETFKNN